MKADGLLISAENFSGGIRFPLADHGSMSALAIMHSARSQIARSAFARIAYLRAIGCDQIPMYSGV
jgi:hypothetical protein